MRPLFVVIDWRSSRRGAKMRGLAGWEWDDDGFKLLWNRAEAGMGLFLSAPVEQLIILS